MPWPRHALEDRREAVQRDQRRRTAGLPATVELGFDPVVVGPENLGGARGFVALRSSPRLPGIAVCSLISGIDVAVPGGRLQSMTRRE